MSLACLPCTLQLSRSFGRTKVLSTLISHAVCRMKLKLNVAESEPGSYGSEHITRVRLSESCGSCIRICSRCNRSGSKAAVDNVNPSLWATIQTLCRLSAFVASGLPVSAITHEQVRFVFTQHTCRVQESSATLSLHQRFSQFYCLTVLCWHMAQCA